MRELPHCCAQNALFWLVLGNEGMRYPIQSRHSLLRTRFPTKNQGVVVEVRHARASYCFCLYELAETHVKNANESYISFAPKVDACCVAKAEGLV